MSQIQCPSGGFSPFGSSARFFHRPHAFAHGNPPIVPRMMPGSMIGRMVRLPPHHAASISFAAERVSYSDRSAYW